MIKKRYRGVDKNDLSAQHGFTLLEITFAVAIFTLIMWAAAQSLIFSYSVLALQEQRNDALVGCQAVLSAMREIAYNDTENEDCPADEPVFPCLLFSFLNQFPESLENATGDILARYGHFFSLPDQQFQIALLDEDGNPAETSVVPTANTNPVFVTVTTTWQGMQDRTYTLSTSAVITNR